MWPSGLKMLRQPKRAAANSASASASARTFHRLPATQHEAEEYLQYYSQDHADWEAVDHLMTLNGFYSRSHTPEHFVQYRNRWAAGHGGYPVVVTPTPLRAS